MKYTFSLYFQVTVMFVLVGIFSVVGAGTLNYLESRKIIIGQFNKSMKDIATTIGSSLNDKADDAADAIMRISRNEVLLVAAAGEIQNFLQVAVDSSSLFNNIYYFDPTGPLVAAAYADHRDLSKYANENFMTYAEQEKTRAVHNDLLRALETRIPVFSAFFKSSTGRLMNSFIVPVVRGDKVIGLLSCGIVLDRTSKLLELMESLKPHPNGYVALINNEGNVLLSAGSIPQGFAPGKDWQSFEDSLIKEAGYLQAVLRLEKSGLGVCTGLPESAIIGLLERLRKGTIFFTLAVGIIVSLFGIFAASIMISPLNDLVRGLKLLRSGKAGERIDRRASGEIAEAISVYNDLTEKIKKDAGLNKIWKDFWHS